MRFIATNKKKNKTEVFFMCFYYKCSGANLYSYNYFLTVINTGDLRKEGHLKINCKGIYSAF